MRANSELRSQIERRRLRHYEIADTLGVSPYTLSHWLQSELPDDKKRVILDAIRETERRIFA